MAKSTPAKPDTAVAVYKREEYPLLELASGENMAYMQEAIAANTGGKGIDMFDLPQIAWPQGKVAAFAVPTQDGVKTVTELTGVVIAWRDTRVYFDGEFDGGGTPPVCSSKDAITGIGAPGGKCEECPLSKFGSMNPEDEKDKRQACQMRRVLFLILPGSVLPYRLSLPPTSYQPCRLFFISLLMSAPISMYNDIVMTISGVPERSNGGVDYTSAAFRRACSLDKADAATFKGLSKFFSTSIDAAAAKEAHQAPLKPTVEGKPTS